MTRILYMSDLHLETERWRLSLPGWQDLLRRRMAERRHPLRGPLLTGMGPVDLAVLAGDIHNGLRGIVYAGQVADYLGAPVVYVAGNHEYYHQYIDRLEPALRAAAGKSAGRVTFLDNDIASFTFGAARLHVMGCTLWTDFALHGEPDRAMEFAHMHMNDYRAIRRVSACFRPENALARHQRARRWLAETLARLRREAKGEKIVAVTHHAPHEAVLGRRTGRIAPSYASHLLQDLRGAGPDLWIHGHTHHRHESLLEGVRVVSAPRGYVSHEGAAALTFRPGVVEV